MMKFFISLYTFSLKNLIVFFLVAFTGFSLNAHSKVQLLDDELSKESVLPSFKHRYAVLNRRVKHADRFEIGVFYSHVLSEAIYAPDNAGINLTYHFSNSQGLHILASGFLGGLNSSGESLREGDVINVGSDSGKTFDGSLAPSKEFMAAAHWQYSAYYGKVSLSKNTILNLSLFSLFGGGAYKIGDSFYPMVNFGFGQRFYFSPRVSLRVDLLGSVYNGPDITSTSDDSSTILLTGNSAPSQEEFDEKTHFDIQIFGGLNILF